MTQSLYSPSISLQLTPMQLPESIPDGSHALSWESTRQTPIEMQRNLLLRPGEASEMVVQIRNLTKQSLRLDVQWEGDFSRQWCQVRTEGEELLPDRTMEAVLYFQLPADFFEDSHALHPHHSQLRLNYQGTLFVYSTDRQRGMRQMESAAFKLYVRPRSLYLNYLPTIYRDVDFVGRFLKIFEQTFEPTVHAMDALWAHLDPLTAPQALLPFLSHWVAWEMQPQISLQRQRHLIRSAMQIYHWRGTRRGLRFYLHLVTGLPLDNEIENETDKHIGITETFSRGAVLGASRLSEDAILGGGCPFHFTVFLRPPDRQNVDEALVRSVIEQEKPAFCTYDLYIEPRRPSHVAVLPSAY